MDRLEEYIKEFQERPREEKFEDYLPLLFEIRNFLLAGLRENPKDVDCITFLAIVSVEMRIWGYVHIRLLESFLNRYEKDLSDDDLARIYTDLAYYYDDKGDGKKCESLLKKAVDLASKYYQTYIALGLYYLEREYKNFQPRLAEFYLKKALDISANDKKFTEAYLYAVALYENAKYEESKKIFFSFLESLGLDYLHLESMENKELEAKKILLEYDLPIFMSIDNIIYNIALCEMKLGNKKKCLAIAELFEKKIKENKQAEEVDAYELVAIYYFYEDYEAVLRVFDLTKTRYYMNDIWEYYYALYKLGKKEEFEALYSKSLKEWEDFLAEDMAREVGEDYSLEEKEDDIDFDKEKIAYLNDMVAKVKAGFKPELGANMRVYTSCYLVDCIRHKK